jgi:hypothetical protein
MHTTAQTGTVMPTTTTTTMSGLILHPYFSPPIDPTRLQPIHPLFVDHYHPRQHLRLQQQQYPHRLLRAYQLLVSTIYGKWGYKTFWHFKRPVWAKHCFWYLIQKAHLHFWRKFLIFSLMKCTQFCEVI